MGSEGVTASEDADSLVEVARTDSLASVLSKVARTLSSQLRMSASMVDLACGYEHMIDSDNLLFEKRIGEGGFATVELRTMIQPGGDEEDGELVAVKRLKGEMMGDQLELKHFIAECGLLRELHHPNLVRCLGVCSMDRSSSEAELRSLCLVQEYVDGGSLRELMLLQEATIWRVYSYAQALDICVGVASGMAYLHTLSPEKVVHRDLKPANILLAKKGAEGVGKGEEVRVGVGGKKGLRLRVPGRSKRRIKYTPKIADLGLVKVLEESHGVEGIVALEGSLRGSKAFEGLEGATATGRTGSLLYMAPEVYSLPGDASKHTYNEKADIFSFGLIMFELFKRQPRSALLACPDEAETMAGETAHGRRPRLPWRWPAPLRALIAECWAEAPAQRPAATEIVARLTEMKPLIVERMDRTGIYRWADGKIPPAGVDK